MSDYLLIVKWIYIQVNFNKRISIFSFCGQIRTCRPCSSRPKASAAPVPQVPAISAAMPVIDQSEPVFRDPAVLSNEHSRR